MHWFCNVWVCVCVGFVMCVYLDNCMGVLEYVYLYLLCFFIVSFTYVYSYLLLV